MFSRPSLLLLILPTVALAQYSPPQPIRYVTTAPTGACTARAQLQYLMTSGALYGCVGGAWVTSGPGIGLPTGSVVSGANLTLPGNVTATGTVQGSNLPIDASIGADKTGATDSATAINAQIAAAAGRPLTLPAGTYVLTSTLSHSAVTGLILEGEGDGTVIDNRVANGCAITLSTAAPSTYQLHAQIRNLKIISTTHPATSSGICLSRAWNTDLEHVEVYGLTGHAVKISGSGGDADSSVFVHVRQSRLQANTGYGMYVDPTTTTDPSYLTIEDSYITDNVAGGVNLIGFGVTIRRTSFAHNAGTGGVYVPYSNYTNQSIEVTQSEFDTNYPQEILVESATDGKIDNNMFTGANGTNTAGNPSSGIILGSVGHAASGIRLGGNRFRIDSTVSPYVAYTVLNSGSTGNRIDTTFWQVFGAGQVKVSDAGTRTVFDDLGYFGARVFNGPFSMSYNHTTLAAPFIIQDETGNGIYLSSQNNLSSGYGVNGAGTLYLHYTGYNAGFTQFRNLVIANGKGADVVTITGSDKSVALNGLVGCSPGQRAPLYIDENKKIVQGTCTP